MVHIHWWWEVTSAIRWSKLCLFECWNQNQILYIPPVSTVPHGSQIEYLWGVRGGLEFSSELCIGHTIFLITFQCPFAVRLFLSPCIHPVSPQELLHIFTLDWALSRTTQSNSQAPWTKQNKTKIPSWVVIIARSVNWRAKCSKTKKMKPPHGLELRSGLWACFKATTDIHIVIKIHFALGWLMLESKK